MTRRCKISWAGMAMMALAIGFGPGLRAQPAQFQFSLTGGPAYPFTDLSDRVDLGLSGAAELIFLPSPSSPELQLVLRPSLLALPAQNDTDRDILHAGGSAELRLQFRHDDKRHYYITAGAGLMQTRFSPPETVGAGDDITETNGMATAGAGLEFGPRDGWRLVIEARYQHISGALIPDHQLGIISVGFRR